MCDQQMLRPACTYVQSDQRLCLSLEYTTTVKLLTEQHLEILRLKEGGTDSSESIHVKMPHCWKSHVAAKGLIFYVNQLLDHSFEISSLMCMINNICCQFFLPAATVMHAGKFFMVFCQLLNIFRHIQ